MQYGSVVAMFCGPHEKGKVSYRRIDAAIAAAREFGVPLLIAGDGNRGLDVQEFAVRAAQCGVEAVIPLYDAQATTLADARLVSVFLSRQTGYTLVDTIHLVTDYWHMPRAMAMLGTLMLEQMPDRRLTITCVNVETPQPSKEVLEREKKGIEDFIMGRYGRDVPIVQLGKPAHPASVTFAYPGVSET